ncbi:MAG TPA: PAS domain S-box protein [Dongiaceae bacterium]|nr:PAS domain S-box protein [Dongiaceae bacterium]
MNDGPSRNELVEELAVLGERCGFSSRIIGEMPLVIARCTADGTIVYLNPAGEKVTGYSCVELVGKNWWRIFYPGEEYSQVEQLLSLLNEGEVRDHEMVLTTRSGERRTIVWNSVNRYDAAGNITEMVGVGADVTERKQAEEALRRGEAHLQVILEATADGILAVDAQGRTLLANRKFAEMWRIPQALLDTADDEVMLSYVLTQLVDPDAFLSKVRSLYDSADQDMDELHFKDGRIFERYSAPLLREGEVVGRVWSFRDVTARRTGEEALRKSEEMYRLLTEISPNAVTVADTSGNIRMANRQALALYGYEPDADVVGLSVFDFVAPEDLVRAGQAFAGLMVTGFLADLEVSLLRKDGSRFSAMTSASIMRDASEEPHLAIIVTTDITQRKQLEEERLKLQKMESLGVLAGGIAHDFNNLLQAIFGNISTARASYERGENGTHLLEQAEQALKMSVNLTTQLLTFAKGGQPILKELALTPVIETAASFALSGARCGCRLTSADGLWPVYADEGQIGRVVQNIVLNAGEAMSQGGTVQIDLANVTLPPAVHPTLKEGGRFVKVTVSDSGTGIMPEHLSRIFDPYFTTKGKGSGLGLAAAFAIVLNHGGALEACSEQGSGSTFSFYLPAYEGSGEKETRTTAATAARKGRILVMDDADSVRLAVFNMLRLLGHEGEAAEDGEAALIKIRAAMDDGNPFDVVILDLTVKGGMGGEKMMEYLPGIDPQLKAIVSSGYADNPVVSNYASYGFSAYLVKPYSIEALRDVLQGVMG